MRVSFLVDKLIDRGHGVVWWTSAFDHYKKEWIFEKDTLVDMGNGLKIFALKGLGYKRNISLSRFIDHGIVALKFKKYAFKMPPPDIILSATPPYDLAFQAVKYAKTHQSPIVIDIRDIWPDVFVDFIPRSLRAFFKLVFSNEFKICEYMLRNATAIVSITENTLKRGLKRREELALNSIESFT
jgi:hypothetical protein